MECGDDYGMEWEPSNHEEYNDEIESVIDTQTIKKMRMEEIKPNVIRKLNDIQELFALDLDSLVKIARHFRWN
jgi:hypothetical protein